MFLLFASSGYVGSKFRQRMTERGLPFRSVSRNECDTYDSKALATCIFDVKARFLINCARYTGKPNVDACESRMADCHQGTSVLPGVIDAACQFSGSRCVHDSTVCIFEGLGPRQNENQEVDEPNLSFRTHNCSFYSVTKALEKKCFKIAIAATFGDFEHPLMSTNQLEAIFRKS